MCFREIRTATNNNLDHLQKDYVIIIWIYRIYELFCIIISFTMSMETSVEQTINPFARPRRNSESDSALEDQAY